jgi:uncharacterized protein with NAD-binding domain and iron-sulfur cluster
VSAPKKRIAILGGGMSSLVTAFELTSLPDWRDRYTITVYQQGWRLGGKGASGRDADRCNRNEEHGLHLIFGCYENVFRVLRGCYAELVREPDELPWGVDDALKPHHSVVMFEHVNEEWERWDLDLPPGEGVPGVGDPLHLSPLTYVLLLIRWARQQAERWPEAVLAGQPILHEWWRGFGWGVDALLSALRRMMSAAASRMLRPISHLRQAETLLEALAMGGMVEAEQVPLERLDKVRHHVDLFHGWAQLQGDLTTGLRRLRIMIDFALAVSKGLIADRVIFPRENWFAIDRYDLRDWLRRHGASEDTCASPLVKGLYDSVFSPPALAAGTILHALYRASHYKGAVLYRMQAGMGDTIFAPLYRVLRDRGVEFRFFHRVERLELSPDRERIARVVMHRQAELAGHTYEPLVLVEGVYSWPNKPRWAQLRSGPPRDTDFEDWWGTWQGQEWTLEEGRHFDLLVLGISIGAFPAICRELIENRSKPAFGDMVRGIRTTQTQGVQLWLRATLEELGWTGGEAPVVIPYADPLNTWADMSQLNARENFPAGRVNAQLYLCAALADAGPSPARPSPGHVARERERVFEIGRRWLENHSTAVWPRSGDAGFDWGNLVDLEGGQGVERLRAQYIVATSNPSDRYVWPVPGSTARRLPADRSGYKNLYLTGDWTLTSVSAGCLEGAAMAGIQTARAIDGRVPRAIYDWLPEGEEVPALFGEPGPRYVVRDGELLAPPPVDLTVKLQTFLVPASFVRLKALCDEQLNFAGKTTYRPLGPFVVFYAADMLNIVPAGSIPELDFGVWLPVVAMENGLPRRLLTYTPYVWVDNSPALVGGRTIFGFPKHVGVLRMPLRRGGPGAFTIDTWIVVQEGGRAQSLRLLEIAMDGEDTGTEPPSLWTRTVDAVAHHGHLVSDLLGEVGERVLPAWQNVVDLFERSVGMPMVFLKQFRAADGTDGACYQAILEAPVVVTGAVKGGPILRTYSVTLLECFSHRIAETLGLRGVERRQDAEGRWYGGVKSIATTWMEFAATVRPGVVGVGGVISREEGSRVA